MLTQEIIRTKRDGGTLSREEIWNFISGVASGAVSEGQIAAFCMAVLFRGMSLDERADLTKAMAASGQTLAWDAAALGGPVLDKHSTGGVGDKVSLILAPVMAACGAFVPMISGRGLGHTGGTLDKLDSIPGYSSRPDVGVLRRTVGEAGCAIVGATADIAPADRRMYAVRDVTGTVEAVDLITASILSKKLAAGLDGLVLDVKAGNGAFCATKREAEILAESLVEIAGRTGLPAAALLTDMDQVLGHSAGNAVEVHEAVAMLRGGSSGSRLYDVTVALAAELLVLGGLADTRQSALKAVDRAIASGAAAERFARMVVRLGGPPDFVEQPEHHLPGAPVRRAAPALRPGFVAAIDTRAVGVAVVALGGGRRLPEDGVDHAVGFSEVAEIGAEVGVGSGRPLAMIHARTEDDADRAAHALQAAFTIDQSGPSPARAGRAAIDPPATGRTAFDSMDTLPEAIVPDQRPVILARIGPAV